MEQLGALDIDFPRLYADLLSVVDNFASDEIAATLGVMGAAFALAFALGTGTAQRETDRLVGVCDGARSST